MIEPRARWLGIGAVVGLAILALILGRLLGGDDSTEGGSTVSYDGRSYWVSSLQVRDDALGDIVTSTAGFEGESDVTLRRVEGRDTSTLAAWLPARSAALPVDAWHLIATDPTPWTPPIPPLSDLVNPTPSPTSTVPARD